MGGASSALATLTLTQTLTLTLALALALAQHPLVSPGYDKTPNPSPSRNPDPNPSPPNRNPNLVVQVSALATHTVVVTSSGAVMTYGNGGSGQLGHGSNQNELSPRVVQALSAERVVQVVAGASMTAVVTRAGRLLTFGGGSHGELGHGDRTQASDREYLPRVVEAVQHARVLAVAVGSTHLAVVADDDRDDGV